MQEFGLRYTPALRRGLRPDRRVPRDAQYLEEMRNLRPTTMGALLPEAVTYPLSSPALIMDFPYPALLRGERTLILALRDEIFDCDESSGLGTPVPLWEAQDDVSPATLAVDAGPWEMASFQRSYFLTNGKNLVFKTPKNSKTLSSGDELTVGCVCNFNNRLMLGDLAGTLISGEIWQRFVEVWRRTTGGLVYTGVDEDFGDNWIVWSEAAGGSEDLPFTPLLMALGYDQSLNIDAYLLDRFEVGDLGMIPLRFTGKVLAIKPQGNSVLVYGARGVSRLTLTTSGFAEEALFGATGIRGRGQIAGDWQEHLWIAPNGCLMRYMLGEGVQSLGFDEFLEPLGDVVTMSFDPRYREVWISDGEVSYIKTPAGLGGPMAVTPTSLVRLGDGTLAGCANPVDYSSAETANVPDPDSPWAVLIRTVPIADGSRSFKSIQTIQMAYENVKNAKAAVYWRQRAGEPYTRGPVRPFNFEGLAYPGTSFVDGKVLIYGTANGTDCRIEDCEFRYQHEDRRGIRGTTGGPVATDGSRQET